MSRYTQIAPCFFSAEMEYGRVEKQAGHTSSIHLILNRPYEDEYVEKQALAIMLSGAITVSTYGAYAPMWTEKMYETKRLMRIVNPLAYYEAFTEFCYMLYTDITCRSLVPHNTFLVYDDEDIYHDALKYLERRKKEGPTMKISLQERSQYRARLSKWVPKHKEYLDD